MQLKNSKRGQIAIIYIFVTHQNIESLVTRLKLSNANKCTTKLDEKILYCKTEQNRNNFKLVYRKSAANFIILYTESTSYQ